MSTKREPLSNSVGARAHPDEARTNTVVAEARSGQRGNTPGPARVNEERSAVVVAPVPRQIATPQAGTATYSTGAAQRNVHVAPNLRDLVAAAPLATPQEAQIAKERRDLNEVVHGVLIIGLAISTALILAGLGLALFYQRDLPTAVPSIG